MLPAICLAQRGGYHSPYIKRSTKIPPVLKRISPEEKQRRREERLKREQQQHEQPDEYV
jgi:hypothetical protein